jgi:hypothetical protein
MQSRVAPSGRFRNSIHTSWGDRHHNNLSLCNPPGGQGVPHPNAMPKGTDLVEALTNSIHVAIRLWVRRVFLRAARLAPYQRENV